MFKSLDCQSNNAGDVPADQSQSDAAQKRAGLLVSTHRGRAMPGSRAPLIDVLIPALAERRDGTCISDDVRCNTIVAPTLSPGITRKETTQRNLEMTTTSRDGVTGRMRGAIPHQLQQSNSSGAAMSDNRHAQITYPQPRWKSSLIIPPTTRRIRVSAAGESR
jgi:hypothetical protein